MKLRLLGNGLICIGYAVLVYLLVTRLISGQLMGAGILIGVILQTMIDR